MNLFSFFRVRGSSMEPYAHPGDFVFVRRFFWGQKPRINDVVVARDPRNSNRLILKRIDQVKNDGYNVKGDNAKESTDSRTFGTIRTVLGKVVACIHAQAVL